MNLFEKYFTCILQFSLQWQSQFDFAELMHCIISCLYEMDKCVDFLHINRKKLFNIKIMICCILCRFPLVTSTRPRTT